MPRPGDVALYIAAALAAAYILNQCVHWWDDDHDDDTPPTLPPLRTHSLPPPLPRPTTLPTEATSDTDTQSLDDILSPPPTHDVLSRRSSVRAHDLFAASHISFSELGSLVAPEDEPH